MPSPSFKLGKTPARPDAVKLKFSTYLTAKLPIPPGTGGHQDLLGKIVLGMLGNDQYGDCVWAGAGHETMLWNLEANRGVDFTPASVLSDYSAVTGFNPKDPSTDQGTDMQLAAKYRQDTGVLDANGNRHKVGAYLAIEKGNKAEIMQAIYLFGAVGIGIEFPSSAMDQFNADEPWTVVKGAQIQGGHYIPGISYDSKFVYIITWGKIIAANWAFVKKYMDEGLVYLSPEMLVAGKSLEGFDLATLQADLAAIK